MKDESPKISVKDAMRYISASMTKECRREFHREIELDGKHILIVGISYVPAVDEWHEPMRNYRIETFVDGKPRSGVVL